MREVRMKKKIAVVVRDRQAEALRMAIGLTLEDDQVDVFVMDRKLEDDKAVAVNVEMLNDLDIKIYTNYRENQFKFMSTEDIARALVAYDNIVPY
jgi:hypothetical protein